MFKLTNASVAVNDYLLMNTETIEVATYGEGVPFCHHQSTKVCPIPVVMD